MYFNKQWCYYYYYYYYFNLYLFRGVQTNTSTLLQDASITLTLLTYKYGWGKQLPSLSSPRIILPVEGRTHLFLSSSSLLPTSSLEEEYSVALFRRPSPDLTACMMKMRSNMREWGQVSQKVKERAEGEETNSKLFFKVAQVKISTPSEKGVTKNTVRSFRMKGANLETFVCRLSSWHQIVSLFSKISVYMSTSQLWKRQSNNS